MGRHENPIRAAGEIADLAQHLRDMRRKAGVTLRQLIEPTGCSLTTLSRATSGEHLPQRHTVVAFTEACGGDVHRALQLWETACAQFRCGRTSRRQIVDEPAPSSRVDSTDGFVTDLHHLCAGALTPPIHGQPSTTRPAAALRMALDSGPDGLPRLAAVVTLLRSCDVSDDAVEQWAARWLELSNSARRSA